jgi:signal transduction histidine kinase
MKLPPEGARWLVSLRFGACAAVCVLTTLAWAFGVLANPFPLYAVGAVVLGYNVLFRFSQRDWAEIRQGIERNILLQILVDLTALTLLLYFADMPRNPFLSFYVFHMIIAGMYLRGYMPYAVCFLATLMVGTIMLLQWLGVVHPVALHFQSDPAGGWQPDGLYLATVFAGLASTLWTATYFTTSIRRYVDRAHAEIRQKEKLLGIGQLVAGIAHQIANPLDGLQNCLHRVGERVKNDRDLTEYVQMMVDALDRIERTAKRVQSFARPHGLSVQPTDVNAVVEATRQFLAIPHNSGIEIRTDLGNVPLVDGDSFTLQEVLFNLCMNAFAAMPEGGTLTLRTRTLGRRDEDAMEAVAIEVADTGVGIPRVHLEKVFEPFFTTRAESGGTGLGLGLCRMLVSEMGGRIEVQSVVGRGTVFRIILDLAKVTPVRKP